MKTETETEKPEIDDGLQAVIDNIKLAALVARNAALVADNGNVTRFSYNHGEIPFPPLVLAPVVHALVERGIECWMVRFKQDIGFPDQFIITSRAEFNTWLTEELKDNS